MKKTRTVKPRLGRPPDTDSADTRRRILDIARLAFAQRGYGAATNRNLGSSVEAAGEHAEPMTPVAAGQEGDR